MSIINQPTSERQAKHKHAAYVASQWSLGYRYGETHDDEAKTDPLMIHYEDLTEKQREAYN